MAEKTPEKAITDRFTGRGFERDDAPMKTKMPMAVWYQQTGNAPGYYGFPLDTPPRGNAPPLLNYAGDWIFKCVWPVGTELGDEYVEMPGKKLRFYVEMKEFFCAQSDVE
jgi:hypothetical protein